MQEDIRMVYYLEKMFYKVNLKLAYLLQFFDFIIVNLHDKALSRFSNPTKKQR